MIFTKILVRTYNVAITTGSAPDQAIYASCKSACAVRSGREQDRWWARSIEPIAHVEGIPRVLVRELPGRFQSSR